ncbi:MAG: hypothetical protein HGA19_17825 [Oscillochloris sp.]|nr:hypothetical protein [Oscillochloris sp.]
MPFTTIEITICRTGRYRADAGNPPVPSARRLTLFSAAVTLTSAASQASAQFITSAEIALDFEALQEYSNDPTAYIDAAADDIDAQAQALPQLWRYACCAARLPARRRSTGRDYFWPW